MLGLFIWLVFLLMYKRIEKSIFFLSILSVFLVIIYIPSINNTPLDESSEKLPYETTLVGEIKSSIKYKDKVTEFTLQTNNPQRNYLAVYFHDKESPKNQKTMLKTGAICNVSGQITQPNDSTNPGEFSYRSFLEKQGINQQLIIHSLDELYCEGSSFLGKIYTIREQIQKKIITKYSDDTAAWMTALVLGNDSRIGEDQIDLFRQWGLSHLLAISGLHIGLIIGLVYFILINTGLMTKEKAQSFMIFFLPLYALLAGGEPSVWRASLMALAFILLNKFNIKLTITDIISIVFILLLINDNYIIYHVGFQFSFIVTLSIILSRKWLASDSSLLFQMLKLSFISQMAILPLQFNYFSMVQPASILLNVIVVPYFSLFVIPAMFIMVFLSFIPILPALFDQLFSGIHSHFLNLLTQIDNTLNFPWVSGPFPIIFVFVYYGLFVLLMKSVLRKKLVIGFSYGVLLTAMITLLLLRPYFSPYGSVTMLDIGQGDAFVIELPYRKGVIFMDAGSTFSFDDYEPSDRIYKQILKPYLQSKGIQSIDAIFISHEHLDHMGSVTMLIEEFSTDQIVVSNYYELDVETIEKWQAHGVKITQVEQGEEIRFHDTIFNVLSPFSDTISENDNSLVALAEFGGKSWLFTGDIEEDAEREIIKRYPSLDVDVLKVAHHGSKTSSTESFINHTRPTFSLISVGENNTYGHPSQSVVETLHNFESVILRTDKDGAVIYKFTKDNGTFYKYLP